jgi:hypothetical protein
LDEVRISRADREPERIATTNETLTSPSTFYSVGDAVALDAPTVTNSSAVTDGTTATLNGNITDTGYPDAEDTDDERGFVWGTTSLGDPGDTAPADTFYDSSWTEEGSFGTGAFDYLAEELTELTMYYFRACAHNDMGWVYSTELEFFAGEEGKVYFELRPDLDETRIRSNAGVPSDAQVGIYNGYSLPIWNSDDEELYFIECVPGEWDGESDILVHVVTALANASESGHEYQLDLAWEHETPNQDELPVTSNTVSSNRIIASDTQYETYKDWFVLDYNIDDGDSIEAEDQIALRLRRTAVSGQYADLDGELIILHMGMLFARGDFLADPTTNVTSVIDSLIASDDLVGGENMILFALFILCGILSWLAIRSTFQLFKLLAGIGWIAILIYWISTPPSTITAGSAAHIAVMLVLIVAAIAIPLLGLGRDISQQKSFKSGLDGTSSTSSFSHFSFRTPNFGKEENPSVERKQKFGNDADEYRENLRRALKRKD